MSEYAPNLPRVLAVAFHYPPVQGSSGVFRTLAFSRFLPRFGWNMTVLTASTRAHATTRSENLKLIPPHVRVVRAAAWDAMRHFSVAGRYPTFLAIPDRWQSWIPGAIISGLVTIKRERPSVIFSTFPIASAHCIGLVLARLSGLPWIADFRDPMYQAAFPVDARLRSIYEKLERQVFRFATRVLVTAPGARSLYEQRYGQEAGRRIDVISNGFDPEAFPVEEPESGSQFMSRGQSRLTLLHSGILYPRDRNPCAFFKALAALCRSGDTRFSNLQVVFRASGHDSEFRDLANVLGIGEIVRFEPPLPYREAVSEMIRADALLVFQGGTCNYQIPAKVYEYLYAGRPIIALTDARGDTGRLLLSMGIDTLADMDNEDAIRRLLERVVPAIRAGSVKGSPRSLVMQHSRLNGTAQLASVLSDLGSGSSPQVAR